MENQNLDQDQDKKKLDYKTIIIVIAVVVVVSLLGCLIVKLFFLDKGNVSEEAAIELIQEENSDLKGYPSDELPAKSIETERADDGWYVAFIQEGSGRPIVSAKCFFVDNSKNVTSNGEYVADSREDTTAEFSVKDCEPEIPDDTVSEECELETCHGLDISCGSNPPSVCTEIYMLGDKCLQYAECGIQDGECQPVENDDFTRCKNCVEDCSENFGDDSEKVFECEGACE